MPREDVVGPSTVLIRPTADELTDLIGRPACRGDGATGMNTKRSSDAYGCKQRERRSFVLIRWVEAEILTSIVVSMIMSWPSWFCAR